MYCYPQNTELNRGGAAVAGVNHLEIPAELAFVFSKLENWNPVNSEKNLAKVIFFSPFFLDFLNNLSRIFIVKKP